MTYLAIVALTAEERIAKFAEFDTEVEANEHSVLFGGFVIPNADNIAIAQVKIDSVTHVVRLEPRVPVAGSEAPAMQAIRILASETRGPVQTALLAIIGGTIPSPQPVDPGPPA